MTANSYKKIILSLFEYHFLFLINSECRPNFVKLTINFEEKLNNYFNIEKFIFQY